LVFFLSVIATVVYVWERAQVIRQQMVISELKAQAGKLETENGYLRLELLHLTNTTYLEQVAERLGFVHPSGGQVIRLPK